MLGIAVILGLLIAAIDNFAFGGEVSPVVVLIGAGCGVQPSRREA